MNIYDHLAWPWLRLRDIKDLEGQGCCVDDGLHVRLPPGPHGRVAVKFIYENKLPYP